MCPDFLTAGSDHAAVVQANFMRACFGMLTRQRSARQPQLEDTHSWRLEAARKKVADLQAIHETLGCGVQQQDNAAGQLAAETARRAAELRAQQIHIETIYGELQVRL
jgi:type II secretory ATPase GspE/PulE/Tfp pilus assembly ATPase PilB-like protein